MSEPKGYMAKVQLDRTRLREQVEQLQRDNRALQSRIDELMLEYCPEEMTDEQKAQWAKHQVPADDAEIVENHRSRL